jgi:MoxR-like ATPase
MSAPPAGVPSGDVFAGGILESGDRERLSLYASKVRELREELRKRIVGQEDVITQLLVAILAEGHVLIVGLPGLAKTLLVSSLAELLSLDFKRIQFTPDLMPSDITGANIISTDMEGRRDFQFLKGPVFANLLLADEINRTPPKTQAALMEAMEERQISVGGRRLPLPSPFFVLATQNPIEQEGTYPLPVSELDRFLLNVIIDYPAEEEEFRIMVLTTSTYSSRLRPVFEREAVAETIALVKRIEVPAALMDYASRIVRRTRPSAPDSDAFTKEYIAWGGGPRATQALVLSAKALAFMDGRHQVAPDDIHSVAVPVLRHRLILRYHAASEGVDAEKAIENILGGMPDGLYKAKEESRRAPSRKAGLGILEKLREKMLRASRGPAR